MEVVVGPTKKVHWMKQSQLTVKSVGAGKISPLWWLSRTIIQSAKERTHGVKSNQLFFSSSQSASNTRLLFLPKSLSIDQALLPHRRASNLPYAPFRIRAYLQPTPILCSSVHDYVEPVPAVLIACKQYITRSTIGTRAIRSYFTTLHQPVAS